MGAAKRREENARAVAFAKSTQCVFCGGGVLADTVDHYPPKGVFYESKWPENYVFPACSSCNSVSREADNWVGWLTRFDPTRPHREDDAKAMERRFRALEQRNPGLRQEMFGRTSAEMRGIARRLNLKPQPGKTYRDLPVAKLPEKSTVWMEIFAGKLGKALHFEHTRNIVPADAAVRHWWYTNASQLEGKVPDSIFDGDYGVPVLRRTNVDLSDQFHYVYQLSEEGDLGLFVAKFGFSFMLVCAVAFDAHVMERIEAAARTELDRLVRTENSVGA